MFKKVDMVEQNKKFLDQAKEYLVNSILICVWSITLDKLAVFVNETSLLLLSLCLDKKAKPGGTPMLFQHCSLVEERS